VDGGVTVNDDLMQFQSDMLGIPLVRPKVTETTALGAACLAGLGVGFWKNTQELEELWQREKTFQPAMDAAEAARLKREWRKAVSRAKGWIKE
jgi:glycerol kinase